jgi:hypothetical protein
VASKIYRDWFKAIRNKQRVGYIHDDHPREGCPDVLGLDKDGKEKVLVRRIHPGREDSAEWRCLFLSDTTQVTPISGKWLEGNSHKQRNSCIVDVHLDVNRAAEQLFDWTTMRMPRPPASKQVGNTSPKKKKPRTR